MMKRWSIGCICPLHGRMPSRIISNRFPPAQVPEPLSASRSRGICHPITPFINQRIGSTGCASPWSRDFWWGRQTLAALVSSGFPGCRCSRLHRGCCCKRLWDGGRKGWRVGRGPVGPVHQLQVPRKHDDWDCHQQRTLPLLRQGYRLQC